MRISKSFLMTWTNLKSDVNADNSGAEARKFHLEKKLKVFLKIFRIFPSMEIYYLINYNTTRISLSNAVYCIEKSWRVQPKYWCTLLGRQEGSTYLPQTDTVFGKGVDVNKNGKKHLENTNTKTLDAIKRYMLYTRFAVPSIAWTEQDGCEIPLLRKTSTTGDLDDIRRRL